MIQLKIEINIALKTKNNTLGQIILSNVTYFGMEEVILIRNTPSVSKLSFINDIRKID